MVGFSESPFLWGLLPPGASTIWYSGGDYEAYTLREGDSFEAGVAWRIEGRRLFPMVEDCVGWVSG